MTEPLEPGTVVRVIDPNTRFHDMTVEIDDYVSPEEADDGQGFYWASSKYGIGDVIVNPGAYEVVLTPKQARERRPPTVGMVLHGLSLTGDHGTFDCNETEVDGDTIVMMGTTPDDIDIAVTLKVVGIEQVTW